LHPGSRILSYVLAALVIPGLSFFPALMLMLAALAGIAWLKRHPMHVVWRTRWLMLVLVLGYGFSQPGDAVMPLLGEWSPTWTGLVLGLERALRLLVLLLWLDLLVLSLSGGQLLSGLHVLMSPLRAIGVDAGRIALRIALTLKAIEQLEQGNGVTAPQGLRRGRGNLRRIFDPVPDEAMPDRVVLVHYPVRGRDVAIPMLLLAGFALLAWGGGWK